MSIGAMRTSLDECVRQDLLWRLRWNLSAPVDNVRISTDPENQVIILLIQEYPVADESMFKPATELYRRNSYW